MLRAAVDIGATIVSFSVWDGPRRIAAGDIRNPQRDIGADMASRLDALREGRGAEMRAMLAEALLRRVSHSVHAARRRVSDIDMWCFAGSVPMLAALADRSPFPKPGSGAAEPPWSGILRMRAEDVLLRGSYFCEAVVLPPLAAAAGADTAAAVMAAEFKHVSPPFILLDAGTNAEVAYRSPDGAVYVAGVPAGAAFEAAGISCGVSPFRGAIDRAERGPSGALRCHVAGDPPHVWSIPGGGWTNNANKARGVCASGLVDVIAESLANGMLLPDGSLSGFAKSIPLRDGLSLTPDDVKLFMDSKAAVCAAVETVLHEAGVSPEEAAKMPFLVAGSSRFGISPANAAATGMWPAHLQVQPAGNEALAGAEAFVRTPQNCDLRLREIAEKTRPVDVESSPFWKSLLPSRRLLAEVRET